MVVPDCWVDPQVGAECSFPSQAQYRQGLELSKQAAQLGAAEEGAGETELPDLAAFTSTQQAFQARLTHFYMAAERQRTDLETLLHLHRFRRKVSELPGPSAHPPAGVAQGRGGTGWGWPGHNTRRLVRVIFIVGRGKRKLSRRQV